MSEKELKPNIRFEGFKEQWKVYKLGDIAELINGRAYKQSELLETGKYKVLRVGNFYTNDDWYYSDLELAEKYYANPEDLLYTWSASFGPHIWNGDKVIYHYHIWKVDLSNKLEKLFAVSLLEYDKTNILSDSNGSTMIHITKASLENKAFSIPKIKEQKLLGSFFEEIKVNINKREQELHTLNKFKQAMLQKMFPKEGETVPEVRFKGFEEKWKEFNLGEITNITTGKLDANAMVENGRYDFFTSGIKKYKINNYAFEGPAITIAGNGATVGYMHLADGKFNAYQRTYVLSDFAADRIYLFYEIQNRLPKKIKEEARTGNIPYIVMDMLSELSMTRPSKEEQILIGSYFQTLDDNIQSKQAELDKLKQFKQAMLDKMFV